jgi:hypothetical protein
MKLAGSPELVGSTPWLETFAASKFGTLFPSVHKNSQYCLAEKEATPPGGRAAQVNAGQ